MNRPKPRGGVKPRNGVFLNAKSSVWLCRVFMASGWTRRINFLIGCKSLTTVALIGALVVVALNGINFLKLTSKGQFPAISFGMEWGVVTPGLWSWSEHFGRSCNLSEVRNHSFRHRSG